MEQSASGVFHNSSNEHISRLLEEIATASIFKRVFQWREILLNTGAAREEYEELKRLLSEGRRISSESDGSTGITIPAEEEQRSVIHSGDFSGTVGRDQNHAFPEPAEGESVIPHSDKEDALKEIEQTIVELQCEIHQKKSLIVNLKDCIYQITAQKDTLSEELTRCSADLERYIKEQEEMETALESYHLSVDEPTERFCELRINLTHHCEAIHSLRRRLAYITSEIEQSESKRCECMKRYECLTVELRNLESHIHEREIVLKGLLHTGN